MKTYRTATQWLELLQQRSNFKGTNIEFCQHHNVAITTYYKQRALQAENQQGPSLPKPGLSATLSSRFIQLKQTTTEVCAQTHQNVVQFDIRTGQLMFPANLATNDIVAIIKGLMA
ncbi:IS66 family insertion sequence element accessory protein TnpB [Shewanella sp. T24-MNA-CIBAN-0130]|uniref:IS66 family insertion sequence element accessory protein TnpB n=1 Tax=Shewanella sp. T24-MNA-CIBAN-0130 TaxID=3140470 RepID=UPI00333227AA